MKTYECYQLVFSSSCTVYGNPDCLPITEETPIGNVTSVYGRTKYIAEEMLMDLGRSSDVRQCTQRVHLRMLTDSFFLQPWNIISLRYFNPVGAHPSGLIGEDPTKPYPNLMPLMAQVAQGTRPFVTIFGNDYNTPDGTGI